MKPSDTSNTAPAWQHGTDLRDDSTGIYRWPHPQLCEEGQEPVSYPSVTTILDEFMGSGMRFAEHWFCAEYVHQLAVAAKDKELVDVWVEDDSQAGGSSVQVKAIDVLLNQLPDAFGPNFGKHWIKNAGPREMRKRANRGTVLHEIMENWAYGMRVDNNDVGDYVVSIIQGKGFALDCDYVEPYARQLLIWCEQHVEDVLMAEAVVMNDTYGYAGTLDTLLKLRGYPELDAMGPMGMVDVKGSKSDQPSHELQGAAYYYGEYIGVPNTAERVAMPRPHWMANLYVQPEKVTLRYWPRITTHDDPQDCIPFRAFLHARVMWEAMYSDAHPKTIKPYTTVRGVKPGDAKLPAKLSQGKLPV